MPATVTASHLVRVLNTAANPRRAASARRFFKSGPGQPAAEDVFLGVSMPVLRKLAKETRDLPLPEADALLQQPVHEARMLALLILAEKFGDADPGQQTKIARLYLRRSRRVDNWDLVDASAHRILGPWLWRREKSVLDKLSRSPRLWERRMAILATLHFIRQGSYTPTLKIAGRLLADDEDLVHKATGWMLREIGNRERPVLEEFLQKHYRRMPRTMLRYAIEKFPERKRQAYLKGRV